MSLSDARLRSLRPESKPRRYFDERGFYLQIEPSGAKGWRLKYRFAGKEKLISLGRYPTVGLKTAREAREEARVLLSRNIDPSTHRKQAAIQRAIAASHTFEAIGREFMTMQEGIWDNGHLKRQRSFFDNDVYPAIGARPLSEITAPEILLILRRIQKRSLDRAHRCRQTIGQIFRYGIATGRCERNPAPDLQGALPSYQSDHFAAPTDPKTLAPLLRAIYGYQGTPAVTAALRLAPLVFARPGELRKMKWADVDLQEAEWRYVSSKTKKPHLVPLAQQAVAILRELEPLTGANGGVYVFPGARSLKRPMSDNAVLAAMRRADIGKDELTGMACAQRPAPFWTR